jgi:outer membrane lipoprotein-sorting protein
MPKDKNESNQKNKMLDALWLLFYSLFVIDNMKGYKTIFLVLLLIVAVGLGGSQQKQSGYSIALKMFKKSSQISSLTYVMKKQERIDGKMVKQSSFTKMEKTPFKVYVKQLAPKKGVEVLYVDGKNSKALINPNGFPWINLKLNPSDGIMRNDQHHTIFQSGFDHVVSILKQQCKAYNKEIEKIITHNGTVSHKGILCYSISLNNPYFEYVDYQVVGDESVEDIAIRNKLSEHMIVEINDNVKDYDDVKAGQIIKIPNGYCPKMLLLIDKKKLTPVKMEVHDDKGLYELYEYSEVVINPTFAQEEFTSSFSEYGF